MSKPRLLDLFCGAGGAAMGYHRAGFDVVGVDIEPQPNYPFEFEHHDAMVILRALDDGDPVPFDAIHASPPCQRWLGVPSALGEVYPDLLTPTRERLKSIGLPYIIENVPGAPLDGFILCGSTFGLPVVRHRRFEVQPELGLVPSMCSQRSWKRGPERSLQGPSRAVGWDPGYPSFDPIASVPKWRSRCTANRSYRA